jgi:hypothetical protein
MPQENLFVLTIFQLFKLTKITMKKIPFLFIYILIFINLSCKKSEIFNEEVKKTSSKVIITFGNIKHNDWIQIDNLEKLPHLLDTMKFRDFFDGSILARSKYPQLYPMEDLQDYLWISQRWVIGSISNRWIMSFDGLGGIPAYSLYFHLVNVRQIAYFYNKTNNSEQKEIYKITFQNFSDQEVFWQYEQSMMVSDDFKRLSTIIIERLDGKPIEIRTSQGYDAKIEYQ